ncbi:hypothetical protein HQ585_07850, partial [candidate division KSB1 bacterium]|nr:hypothetical protein [candidate division KSB1 bacterium]
MKKLDLKLLLIFVTTICAGFGQTADSLISPLQHDKGFYQGSDGRLYVAQSLPIYFLLSTSIQGSDAVLLKPDQIQTLPMTLSEGKNTIQNPGGSITSSDESKLPAVFEVWADGSPPRIQISFLDAAWFQSDQVVFYGSDLRIALESEDTFSGVRETYLSINSNPFVPFDSTRLDFTQDGEFFFRYYAVDHVGNVSDVFNNT